MKTKPKRCKKCPYYKQPRVKSSGGNEYGIAMVGEAPGRSEVEEGKPFVGEAGQMLNNILKKLKLKRRKIRTINTVSCRPPKNENPKPEAIARCRKRLWKELINGKFKLIVCLGRFARNEIMGPGAMWGRFRRVEAMEGTVAVAVKHPAYWNYRGKDLDGAVEEYKIIRKWFKHKDVFDE